MDKGTRFHRADLQIHTPRDAQWQGSRPVTDAERAEWATALIAACRQRGLRAIAITDHHDTVMYKHVRHAASIEADPNGIPVPPENRVVVFPGLELTLALPCQCLLLLDAEIETQMFDMLPNVLSFPLSDEKLPAAAQTQPLAHFGHPNDVEDRLNEVPALRGRFIVLPHVQEKGHKSIIRAGFQEHYRTLRSVGGYVDGLLPPLNSGARQILEGKNTTYGNKPLGVFQTSDSRKHDFSTLGQPSSWIKWSQPTAEALRQACLARQSRIRESAPHDPAITIRRVEVSASKFLGSLNLFVNRHFTALIGGRGTGKSTMLEYVRWALCVPNSATNEDEALPDYESRTKALIENTLAALQGSVRVWVDVRGVTHVVERRTSAQPEVRIKIAEEEFRASTEEEVRRLIPVEAYRQKQLSSIGGKPEDVLRFVLAPVSREVAALRDRLEQQSDRLRTSFARVRSKQKAAAQRESLAHERESLLKQRDAIRGQLIGLNPEDAKVLAQADAYALERSLADHWKTNIGASEEAIHAAMATARGLAGGAVDPALPDFQLVSAMREALQASTAEIREHLEAALDVLRNGKHANAYRESEVKLNKALEEARERFRQARTRAQAHESALKQIDALSRRITELQTRIGGLTSDAAGLSEAVAEFEEAAQAWSDILRERAEITSAQCQRIGLASKNMIRGTVVPSGDIKDAFAAIADIGRGTKIRATKWEALSDLIANRPLPLQSWLAVLDELRAMIGLGPDTPVPQCPTLRSAGFNDHELRALAGRLDDDSWVRLRLITPEDVVRFEFRVREGDYIGFAEASAGQRATALMRVLLAQEDVPLMVDQPEDDLDNSIIHEIAQDIWEAKTRRQIIFASHNANLVVNGDADLIAFFDYRVANEATAGEVKVEGAIDDRLIRDAITSIMEGGRDAFALRRAKYNF